ncbi:MAG: hypothetical protein AB7T06_14885 [Kofleriaceae bacterium]
MATKKTTTKAAPKAKATKAAPKAEVKAKAPKAEKKAAGPRHPKARADAAGGKASLAKSLAASLVTSNDSADAIEERLKTASNSQLLRLQKVVTAVKSKWGDRDKLIAAIGTAQKKSKDQDYLNKLATYSLPHLFDLAIAQERRARS